MMVINIKRPYVLLNTAMTLDGKIDTEDRRNARISSTVDFIRVDQLRASVDAVMVGGHTLVDNDPQLTVKSEKLRNERVKRGLHPNPVKVGVVTQARLKPESRFLTTGPAEIILFTTSQTSKGDIDWLQRQGVKVFVVGDERVDLTNAMQRLALEGIQRILVEGGGTLNNELLRLNLIDEICVYIAPLIFGGKDCPTFVEGQGFNEENAIRLNLSNVDQMVDGGIVLHYFPRKG